MIRKAAIHDVPAISAIVNDCAEYGLMLHRSQSYLYEHVRDFHVCAPDGQVVGVCGLNIVWANLAEIYALAVSAPFRGQGLGKQLVGACLQEARDLEVRRIMTLTYERAFFEKLGFRIVDRQELPMKVWSECVRCAKNQACDEIAMIRVHEDLPQVKAPPAPQPREYEVPVVLSSSLGNSGGSAIRRPKMDEPR